VSLREVLGGAAFERRLIFVLRKLAGQIKYMGIYRMAERLGILKHIIMNGIVYKTQKIYNRLKNEVNELLPLPFFERDVMIVGVLTPPGLVDRALCLLAIISA